MRDRLLVVDGDPTSLRVMDVSLRSAGFDVETATNGTDAWALLEAGVPDLIIADTDLSGIDGFELCLRLRKNPLRAGVPFIFLATDKTLEHKIRSLAAGANDYLVKPAYIKEVVARVRALLQRRDRDRLASDGNPIDGRDRFAGSLADITVVDLLQLIEGNGRSGMAHLRGPSGAPAAIYFRHGKVVDAEVGRLSGTDAVTRLFSWTAGSFELEWRSIRRQDAIARPSSELVVEGMKRLDQWHRLCDALPDLNAVFEVDYRLLAERLPEIPDEVNGILRLCDGVRTILQVIEDCAVPDVEALTALLRLREEGLVYNVSAVHPPERDPGTARFEDWLGAGSPPFSSRPVEAAGSGRIGPGSGPVEQSFAERLQAEAAGDDPTAVPAAPQDPKREVGPPRRRTAPGLGQTATATVGEATASGATSGRRDEGIPEPRSDQDNVIEFPRPGDPHAAASAPKLPTAASGTPVSSDVEDPSIQSPTSGARPTLPLGRAGELVAHHGAAPPPEAPPPVDVSTPEPLDAAATGPAFLTDTYRGFGPKPGQVLSRRAEARVVTREPNDGTPPESGPSGRAITSGTLISEPSGIDAPPEIVDPRAPTDMAPSESTVRISFPDEDITRGDALDELGLPSRWRGMRLLAIASVAGVLAAVGVYRYRASKSSGGEPGGSQAVAVLAPTTAPNPAPAPAQPALRAVPPSASPQAPLPSTAVGTGEVTPRAPAIELPNPDDPIAAPGVGPPRAQAPPEAPGTREPNEATPSAKSATAPAAPAAPVPAADFPRQLSACRAAFARNKLRNALSACTAAVDADPNSAEALTILAHTELNRGRMARASELATKAVTLDPNLADAYVIIGGARQDSGQNREAKLAYRRYLQLAPQGRYADELRSIVNTL